MIKCENCGGKATMEIRDYCSLGALYVCDNNDCQEVISREEFCSKCVYIQEIS